MNAEEVWECRQQLSAVCLATTTLKVFHFIDLLQGLRKKIQILCTFVWQAVFFHHYVLTESPIVHLSFSNKKKEIQ